MKNTRKRILAGLMCLAMILGACTPGGPATTPEKTSAEPRLTTEQPATVPSDSSPDPGQTSPEATLPGETTPPETTPVQTPPAETTLVETTEMPTEPVETTPPETTEAPRNYTRQEENLKAAIDELESRRDWGYSYIYSQSMTIAGEEWRQEENGNIFFRGTGEDQTVTEWRNITTVLNNEDERSGEYRRSYANGVALLQRGGEVFRAETDPETFRDWLMDPIPFEFDMITFLEEIVSETNYKIYHYKVNLGPDTVYDPVDPEEEDVIFSGEVHLDNDNKLLQITYTFEYMLEGMRGQESMVLSFGPSGDEVPEHLSFTIDETEGVRHEAIPLEDLRIVELLDNAQNSLEAGRMSMEMTELVTSYAAGQVLLKQETMAWDKRGDLRFRDIIDATTYSSIQESFSYDAKYAEGMLEETIDGEAKTMAVDEVDLTVGIYSFMYSYWPRLSDFSSARLIEADDYWLIEFDYDEIYGEELQAHFCNEILQDPDFLSENADSFTLDKASGYLSLEKATGLPMCCGIDFSGRHRIRFANYELSAMAEVSFLPMDPLVEYQLTDELPPTEAAGPDPTPLFYRVTAENGQTMWLFGTIHVGDERTGRLPDYIWAALQESDALAVECDTSPMDDLDNNPEFLNLYYECYLYGDGSTAYDHVSSENAEAMEETLKVYGGYLTMELMNYIVGSVNSTIENGYMKFGRSIWSDMGVEKRLEKQAEEWGIPLWEVESLAFQMKMLSDFPERWQELDLESTMESGRYAYNYQLMQLYELWCEGDEYRLDEELTGEPDWDEMTEEEAELYRIYNKAMMTDRNANMIKVALEYLAGDKVVFYAVGLAHLLGEDGIVQGLKDAGCTVERVFGTNP